MNNMRNLCCNIALQCWKLDVKILIPGSWIIVCIGNWKLYCTVVHCKFFRTFNAKKNIETGARSLELLGWGQIMSTWLLHQRSRTSHLSKSASHLLLWYRPVWHRIYGCNWLIECYILFEDLPLTSCLRATWPPHLTSVSLPVRAAP